MLKKTSAACCRFGGLLLMCFLVGVGQASIGLLLVWALAFGVFLCFFFLVISFFGKLFAEFS